MLYACTIYRGIFAQWFSSLIYTYLFNSRPEYCVCMNYEKENLPSLQFTDNESKK